MWWRRETWHTHEKILLNIFISCRWFVVCRFIMSSELVLPHVCIHTHNHYCHDTLKLNIFYFLDWRKILSWSMWMYKRSVLQHYHMQCHCILLYCQRFKRQQTHEKRKGGIKPSYVSIRIKRQCCLCWREH